MTISFDLIYEQALMHKNGDCEEVESSIGASLPAAELATIDDSRWLSQASKAIFSAGFNWSVVDKKWPAHEVAFAHFDPQVLVNWPEEAMDGLLSDSSIIRHGAKIRSVFENAAYFSAIAKEHGSVGAFIGGWPQTDYLSLLAVLKKNGSRMGGTSVQYFLRVMGVPSLILSRDVIAALIREGVIDKPPTSKSALGQVQEAVNELMVQSGRDLTAVSRLLALSVG